MPKTLLDLVDSPKLPQDFVNPSRQPLGSTFAEEQVKNLLGGNASRKLEAVKAVEDQSIADSAVEILGNAGIELKDIIAGLPLLFFNVAKKAATTVAHPIDTVESITSGEALDSLRDTVGTFLDSVSDDYRKRYGPLFEGDFEKTWVAFKDKPLSYLLDLSGALSLTGGALKSAGEAVTKQVASKGLKTVGTHLTSIGANLDPLNLSLKGAGKVSEAFPKLPFLGKEAVAARIARKQGRYALIESFQDATYQVEKELDTFNTHFNQLSDEEKQFLPLHLSRLEIADASELSPAFNKATAAWEDFIGGEESRKLLGITSQEARRRAIMPVILKRFKEGTLNFNDDVLKELTENGFIRPGNPLTDEGAVILNPKGVLDFSEEFFRQAETQLTPAELGATYFPLLDGEITINPGEAITRVGRRIKNPQSPFNQSFTGAIVEKILKTRDPGILADTREVVRRFTNDLTVARSMENFSKKLIALGDVDGTKLAKRLYIGGKIPKNIAAFDTGADAAELINQMNNVATGTIDDIFQKAVGKNHKAFLKDVAKKAPKGIKRSALAKRADDIVIDRLKELGYDGYFINKKGIGFGQFRFVDSNLNPFQKLNDHVVWHPTVMLDSVRKQEGLSKRILELMDNKPLMNLEEAYGQALKDVFPQTKDFYDGVKQELLEASDDVDIINTELIDKANSAKFLKDFSNGLKTDLKGEVNAENLKNLASSYEKRIKKFYAKNRKVPPTTKQLWAYQIPKHVANEVQDLFAPIGNTFVRNFIDAPLNAWRTSVLNFSSRWHLNNIVGGIMMNATAGVFNPSDYMRAGKIFIHGLGKRFPTKMGPSTSRIAKAFNISEESMLKASEVEKLIPNEIHAGTFARIENYSSNFLKAAENPQNKMHAFLTENAIGRRLARAAIAGGKVAKASADFNSMVDSFFRNANFLSQVRGQIRKESTGILKKIAKTFYVSDDEVIRYLDNVPNKETISKMVDSANRWLPNYLKLLNAPERRFVRRIVPFYSWYKHMFGVALSMPLNHPKRAVLISQLAKVAKDANDRDFAAAGLPPEAIKLAADYLESTVVFSKDKNKVKLLSLRGINPFMTILEIPNIGGALRPELKIAIEQLTHKDLFTGREFNKTIKIGSDGIPREIYDKNLLDSVIRNVPQAELIKRVISPEVTDQAGQVVYRRDRALEVLKFLGANISERDIQGIIERAHKQKGMLAGAALRNLIKRDPKKADDILKLINQGKL